MTPPGGHRITDLAGIAGSALSRLPWLHRILLENLLRRSPDALDAVPDWLDRGSSDAEIPFYPGRVLMHDTTCGPALVDIAAARAALAEAGGDPAALCPVLPVDVSTDHSVAVDYFGNASALRRNMERELERNAERYRFMKWAALSLPGVRIHPPGTGIMHSINLERLATVVAVEQRDGEAWAVPDTLIGTDSHTPMVNGMGVLGWGVGGLEAESVMFGMPVMLRVPEVVGMRLTGRLPDGVLATDLALTVTERLRRIDLSGRFVEFFGPGMSSLSVGQRAVVANMAPEYGSSSGYFPVDDRVLTYLAETGRSSVHVALVRDTVQRLGLWFDPEASPRYAEVIELDLANVRTSLAGPRRPQDLLPPSDTRAVLVGRPTLPSVPGAPPDGAVAIAAITSCTNTTDPGLLVAAGLLARKARARGMRPKSWVKTSLAPGSPAAERYLRRTGLLDDLEALGFGIVGYGCTTCIGNAGELTAPILAAVAERGVLAVAVLSGNRNFPGRVHGALEDAFLASPPMVVAYALAGDVDRDILTDPVGHDGRGAPVRLAELWPSGAEIDAVLAAGQRPDDYAAAYEAAEDSESWRGLDATGTPLYPWNPASTYLRRPPFADGSAKTRLGHYLAHPIIVLGDDITTDHISPAGAIPPDSDAGRYLVKHGESAQDLNVYASRRGNWEVMLRGLFSNRTVRNRLGDAIPPGKTIHTPSGERMALWQAAERYRDAAAPVVIVAGERYGTGSSRDWAAKGANLLGARAVLAASFERIHRSNLVNMGVLPLRLPAGMHPDTMELRPGDQIEVDAQAVAPRAHVAAAIHRSDGTVERFTAQAAVETGLEAQVLTRGGIIPLIIARATVG